MSAGKLDVLLAAESDHFLPSTDPAGTSSFSPLYEYLCAPLRELSLPFHYHLDSPQRCTLSYLAGSLESRGLSCAVADNVLRDPEEAARFAELLSRGPAVVGISASSLHLSSSVKAIASRVRRVSPSSVIVIGGPGLEFNPGLAEHADAAVEGDGELALEEIARAAMSGVRPAPGTRIRGRRDLSLDRLPAWTACRRRSSCYPVEASRGCAHACVFCSYPGRGRQEYRPLPLVMKELRYVARDLGASCLRFTDANLTSDGGYVSELCRAMIKEGIRVPWSCFARADELARDAGLCRLMKEAGCFWVYCGAESPDGGILSAMGKGFTPADIERSVENVKKAGMAYHANFVMGFPGETSATAARARDFIISSGMDTVSFTVLGVTPGLAALAARGGKSLSGLSGEGHGWSHSGMDYRTARDTTAGIIKDIASRDGAPLVASHGIGMYYLMGGGADFRGVLDYFTAVRDWHRSRPGAGDKVRDIYLRTSAGFAIGR